MSEKWHYSQGHLHHGPVAASELRRLAACGRLAPDDLVWKEGLPDWVEARKLRGLFATEATAARVPDGPDEGPQAAPLIEGIHQQRLGLAILAGTGMLATFMPWVRVPVVGSIPGTAGDGWITLLLFLPALVLSCTGDRRRPIEGGRRLGAAIPAGFAALLGVVWVNDHRAGMGLPSTNAEALLQLASGTVQSGVGLYLVIVAGAGICAAAWALERWLLLGASR